MKFQFEIDFATPIPILSTCSCPFATENALFWANYSGYSVVPGPMGGPGHQPDIPFSTWDNTSLVAESLGKVLSRM